MSIREDVPVSDIERGDRDVDKLQNRRALLEIGGGGRISHPPNDVLVHRSPPRAVLLGPHHGESAPERLLRRRLNSLHHSRPHHHRSPPLPKLLPSCFWLRPRRSHHRDRLVTQPSQIYPVTKSKLLI